MGLARACVVSACELKLMHFGDPPDDPPSTPILVRSKSSGMYRALTLERLSKNGRPIYTFIGDWHHNPEDAWAEIGRHNEAEVVRQLRTGQKIVDQLTGKK